MENGKCLEICDGKKKFKPKKEQNETFGDKMRKAGWHNVYDEKPKEPGIYEVYRRNDTRGKAEYIGNGVWKHTSGWSFCWWRELKGSDTSGK